MSFLIEQSEAAAGDLLDIWLALAHDHVQTADRHLQRLEHAIAGLADNPRIGPARDDIRPGMRAILRTPYLVFYAIDDERRAIRIVRVIDARRDLVALLRD